MADGSIPDGSHSGQPPCPVLLTRAVSTRTHSTLNELAEECICPISHALMVDPVIAADGHTYDRAQIESWLQRADHGAQATSPQTREPLVDTRLLPNLAIRRTIQRLVDSGRLDDGIVKEWQESMSEQFRRASTAVRDKSLKRFPLGTDVEVVAVLSSAGGGEGAGDDFLVDVRAYAGGRPGGGLFGGPPEAAPDGRLLLKSAPASAVLRASRHLSADIQHTLGSFLELSEDRAGALTPAALPADELQRRVFSSARGSVDDETSEGLWRASADDTLMVVMHMLRRLKSTGGLSDVAGVEFEVLEEELTRRHKARVFQYLIPRLSRSPVHLKAVVQSVSDRGEFTLRFEGEGLEGATATVPGDSSYIHKFSEEVTGAGPFGVNAGGGLFGPNNTAGGLFGPNAAGGLFGAAAPQRLF